MGGVSALNVAGDAFGAGLLGCTALGVTFAFRGRRDAFRAAFAAADVCYLSMVFCYAAAAFLARDWATFAVMAVLFVLAVWGWLRRRKRRDRAPRSYGYKAKAALAALAAKAREAAKPRPVLKPAPGGAR